MAQSATALELHAPGPSQPASALSSPETAAATDAHQKALLEYQKLAQFRDTILAGKHPHIKLPASTAKAPTVGQPSASNARARSAQQSNIQTKQPQNNSNARRADNTRAPITNGSLPAVAVAAASTSAAPLAPASATSGAPRSEINPIFLEKSEDLVRAELKIQRQRLEKSLRDELEQRKASAKAAAQEPESLLEFNLSDVLVKALTLVQATSAPIVPDPDVAGNGSESGDSFDNNTFYSSQHDTPEPHDVSTGQPDAQDTIMEDSAENMLQDDPYSPTQNFALPPVPSSVPRQAETIPNLPLPVPAGGIPSYPPGLGTGGVPLATSSHRQAGQGSRREGYHEVQYISSGDSGANSRSGDSGNMESDQPIDLTRIQGLRYQAPHTDSTRQPSPLIRAHDLSPYAPQPAHVSPLAFGPPSAILGHGSSVLQGAPAPVTTLRHQDSAATSPESSTYGDKGAKRRDRKERKREKRKQRARNRPGYVSPDIKPEPRSPSPITAPTMARPAKRRRSNRGPQDVVVETLASGEPSPRMVPEQQLGDPIPAERMPYVWERIEENFPPSGRSSAVPSVYRPEQPQIFERRYDEPSHQYVRRVYSPPQHPSHYAAGEPRPSRAATYSVPQPEYREGPAYPQAGRMSVRPHGDRARSRSPVVLERRSPIMAPPGHAPQPTRIIVDRYGREYYEPSRPASVIRHSAVPATRPREHEIMYEKAPTRAISRIPADGPFEENGIIYRRTSPAYSARRVVTQPEHSRPDYRGYRDRDYSNQPIAMTREEYVEYRDVRERRVQPEAVPGDYITRSISVRPQEAMPYYSSRVQSIRPDLPPRHYAASVRPEARREPIAPPHALDTDYDPRSAGQDLPPPPPPHGYSARPIEHYYYEHPGDAQVTYSERPRAAPAEVVYIDDPSRSVYR